MRLTILLLLFFAPLSVPFAADEPAQTPDNSYKLVMEGWHHQRILYLTGKSIEEGQTLLRLQTPYIKEKVEVALNLQAREKPLIVLLPGLFAGYESVESLRLGQLLVEQGFNVLRVPNPVSRHVVKLGPTYAGLDFESEASVYVDIVKQVQAIYHFPIVHLTGVSYGAFISPIVATKLGGDFNGKLFLISPPYNIYSSLKTIDAEFDKMKDEFDSFPIDQLGFLAQIYWAKFLKKDIYVSPEFAKTTLIVYGFHRTFVELHDMRDQAMNPRPWWRFYQNWGSAIRKKQNEMRFVKYLQEFNPKFFDKPAKHEVMYWIKKSGAEWTILTAPNDFINSDASWPKASRVYVFENGGHVFGYWDQSEFLDKIKNFFK